MVHFAVILFQRERETGRQSRRHFKACQCSLLLHSNSLTEQVFFEFYQIDVCSELIYCWQLQVGNFKVGLVFAQALLCISYRLIIVVQHLIFKSKSESGSRL